MMDNLVALLLGRAGAAGGPAERDAVSDTRTTTEAKAVTVSPWLSVAIPAGAVFAVRLDDPDGVIASDAVNLRYYADGAESQSILANDRAANTWHYFTAAADIANLTIYQPAASVVDSGDIRLKAKVYTEATGLSTAIAPSMPPVATTNLAAGDLVMQGTTLYRATQAIVAGAEIVPGTNVEQTNLAGELDPVVNVTGATATIAAMPRTRYLCGTLTELTFTPCASGLCGVRFTAGSSMVLSIPNTVKMPDWWVGVEAGKTYEIMVADGVYGVVTSWT